MPRSNSLHSSGASITSEEDNAPIPVASNLPLQSPVAATMQGTTPSAATEKFRRVVTKVGHIFISPPPHGWA